MCLQITLITLIPLKKFRSNLLRIDLPFSSSVLHLSWLWENSVYLNARLLRLIVQQPMSRKFRDNLLQTNQEYPARSFATGVNRIMLLPLRYFDMVRPASLLTATALDWATWDVSASSVAAPKTSKDWILSFVWSLGKGKSATKTYNLIQQVLMVNRFHVHAFFDGISVFVKDWRQQKKLRDPAVHPPWVLPRTMSESEIFCNKIVKLPSECSVSSCTSVRRPATKFCLWILAARLS
jgi:hypothetical protein